MLRPFLSSLKRWLLFLAFAFADRAVACAVPVRRLPSENGRVRNLLLVRCDGIGDFVLWLAGAQRLRDYYDRSHWRIALLGNVLWEDLARDQDVADEYLPIDVGRFEKNFAYRAGWIARLRRRGFDLAISPSYTPGVLAALSLVGRSGARERIAAAADSSNATPFELRVARRWLTREVDVPRQGHVLERNAAFVRSLTWVEAPSGLVSLRTRPLDEALRPPAAYFLIAPGAGYRVRAWPAGNFAAAAREVCARTGWIPILAGGPHDRDLAERVRAAAPELPWRDTVGRASLVETASLVAGARYLIGNESGLAHIGAALGVPVLCILGGGHFGRFMPYPQGQGKSLRFVYAPMPCYGCNWVCIYQVARNEPCPCVRNVTSDAVLEAIMADFGRNKASRA